MSYTPETWDDVGCLRIQVDCVSKKVEDVQRELASFGGLSRLEFQDLKKKVVQIYAQDQQQKKETCRMKVYGIIVAVVLGCILSLQLYIVYTGAAPRSTHRPSDEVGNPNLAKSKASEARTMAPGAEVQILVPGSKVKKDTSSNIRTEAIQRLQKPVNDADAMKRKEKKLAAEQRDPENQRADDGTDKVGTTHKRKVAPDGREDAEDAEANDSDKREDREDSEKPQEVLGHKEKLPIPIEPKAVLPGDPAETESQEVIKVAQDNTIPLPDRKSALPPLHSQIRGLFWVCFPIGAVKSNVKKYASVFNQVARSQKWMVHPICWFDTETLDQYEHDEHLCDHVEKTTFVVEMDSSPNKRLSGQIPAPSSFTSCWDEFEKSEAWFNFDSPIRFRQILPADQDIQVDVVDKFLNDVYSGKLPKLIPHNGKRDL